MRAQTFNDELVEELEPYRQNVELIAGITSALGAREGDTLDKENFPIAGYFIRANSELFSAYILTPGRFILYELAASGQMLSMTTGVERVRRVVEQYQEGRYTLLIELDADRRITRSDGEGFLEPGLDAEGAEVPGKIYVRIASNSSTLFTGYELLAADEDEEDKLRDFAVSLRNALGL